MILLLPALALAKSQPEPQSKTVPCAVLQEFDGDVQILSPTRAKLLDTVRSAGVPCGGWITIKQGWATLKHRQGYVVKLGADTFVEIFDNEANKHLTGHDHFALYRGRAYLQVFPGSQPVRLSTANARVRLKSGVVLVLYDQTVEESQLITLERSATIENVFEPHRVITVRAGEASSYSLGTLRVVPGTPRAVSLASLKAAVSEIPLTRKEHFHAMTAGTRRAERRMASILKRKVGREPATKKNSYVRHKFYESDEYAQKKWLKKVLGGSMRGEQLLFPKEEIPKRARNSKILIEDFEDTQLKRKPASLTAEQQEKKRLIEELSRIRVR